MEIAHKGNGTQKPLYEILQKLPAPPKRFNLSKDQRYWWTWFGLEFLATKQLTKVDLIHLQRAAFWLDARSKAYAIINEKNQGGKLEGMVQTFKSKANNITGWMSVVQNSDKALDEISQHFGLSIRDRSKLGETKEGDPAQLKIFEDFEQKYAD